MDAFLSQLDRFKLVTGAVPIEIRGIKLGSARQVLRMIWYGNDADRLRNERLVGRMSDCW